MDSLKLQSHYKAGPLRTSPVLPDHPGPLVLTVRDGPGIFWPKLSYNKSYRPDHYGPPRWHYGPSRWHHLGGTTDHPGPPRTTTDHHGAYTVPLRQRYGPARTVPDLQGPPRTSQDRPGGTTDHTAEIRQRYDRDTDRQGPPRTSKSSRTVPDREKILNMFNI